MIRSRLLLHPILSNERSRSLFLLYFATIAAVTTLLWWKVSGILQQAGLGFASFHSPETVPLLSFLMLPYVQITVTLFSVVIAAATTAVSIVGPVKRLEQWLLDWDMGFTLSPLKSRNGDTYDNLIRLINDLYLIKKPSAHLKVSPHKDNSEILHS